MYGCTPGGPGFESRKVASVIVRSWEVSGVSPPCLGEHVKPSVLRLNSHCSSRADVPPEYENDRDRECTCVCAYICAL
ncbi:unnamed protein product, partial [Brenthis ino]